MRPLPDGQKPFLAEKMAKNDDDDDDDEGTTTTAAATSRFFRKVGLQKSGDLPRGHLSVLNRRLTVPGPVEGPRGPKTAENLPSRFLRETTTGRRGKNERANEWGPPEGLRGPPGDLQMAPRVELGDVPGGLLARRAPEKSGDAKIEIHQKFT